MKLLLKVCVMGVMGLCSAAGAGSFSHGTVIGASTKTYDLSMNESPDSDSLKFEADQSARNQCPSSQPIQRISEYEISQRYIPYSSFVTLRVQSLYGCGNYNSDYRVLSFSQNENLKCDHDNNYQCPSGYRCKIQWRQGPYECVKIKP